MEVLTTLNLQNSRFIVITEDGTVNSTFIISSLLSMGQPTILIPFQNSYRHFYHIGLKLGYNLDKMQTIHPIEPLKQILEPDSYLLSPKEIIPTLYKQIRDKVTQFDPNMKLWLIIEDVTKLMDLKQSVKQLVEFKQMLRMLGQEFDKLSIVVTVKVGTDEDSIVGNAYGYIADKMIKLSSLKTGVSDLVSGVLDIQMEGNRLIDKTYHYKLLDRNIRLFAPGTI